MNMLIALWALMHSPLFILPVSVGVIVWVAQFTMDWLTRRESRLYRD